jgi:hypothetical protein
MALQAAAAVTLELHRVRVVQVILLPHHHHKATTADPVHQIKRHTAQVVAAAELERLVKMLVIRQPVMVEMDHLHFHHGDQQHQPDRMCRELIGTQVVAELDAWFRDRQEPAEMAAVAQTELQELQIQVVAQVATTGQEMDLTADPELSLCDI